MNGFVKRKTRSNSASSDISAEVANEEWFQENLLIIVFGASGDLAKKKTFPSLHDLDADDLLPVNTLIYGYARSQLSDEDFREKIKGYLPDTADDFLNKLYYQSGRDYGDVGALQTIKEVADCKYGKDNYNVLIYMAIPPNVFGQSGKAIRDLNFNEESKFVRLIVEKPFGRDLISCVELLKTLETNFQESQLFRIDHYLGKEMVQNLLVLRFTNIWFESMLNKEHVANITLTFKEPFGTQGRGGYFDHYGIIRDIIQNHLTQVLTVLTMEPPATLQGDDIRDAKVKVLKCIDPPTLNDVVLGQYEGYADDPTIENKDTNTPTYACVKLEIQNPRWSGVPIILKAGKALNERKAEMRIQFKPAPAAAYLFRHESSCVEEEGATMLAPRNELVIRLQPHEAIYLKTNMKQPGFKSTPVQTELELNYNSRFDNFGSKQVNPEAYTRLILDVLRGKSAAFVRDDELIHSWKIFTPLLKSIEENQATVKPIIYKEGTRGPKEADEFIDKYADFEHNPNYEYSLDNPQRNSKSKL